MFTKLKAAYVAFLGGLTLGQKVVSLYHAFRTVLIVAALGIALSLGTYIAGHRIGAADQKAADAKLVAAAQHKGIKAHGKVKHKVQTESAADVNAGLHHFVRDAD